MYYRELQEKNLPHNRQDPRGKSEYGKKLEASRGTRGGFTGKKKVDTDKIKSEIKDRLDRFKNLKQPVIPSRAKAPSLKDVENKRAANQESIRRMKERKPHLYREDWLTEGYKKINQIKDRTRTTSQIDKLDDEAAEASKKGDYSKEFRKDQQISAVEKQFVARNSPATSARLQMQNISQSARNQMIGARDRKYGIKPTKRRKVKPSGWHGNYVDKLRRKKEIEEGYKRPNYKKIDKQIEKHKEDNIRTGPDTSLFDPKYRNDSRNRAFKMSGVRDALLRGEDPRQDTRGGAFKKKGNPDVDHRAGYSKNPLNNPPRRVKKAGVGETEDQKGGKKRGVHRVHGTRRLIPSKDGQGYSGTTKALGKIKEDFVVNEEQKPLPMDKMRKQSDKHFKNIKTELGRARNSRDQAETTTDVRRFRRNQFNKDTRTDKVADLVKRRNTIDNMITTRNANPKAFSAKRARKSERNKNIGTMKRMM